jgi:hypothetical protein
MDVQEGHSQDQEGLAGEVMDSLGEPQGAAEEVINDTHPSKGEGGQDDLPESVRVRLWRQERKHAREMRNMRAQVEHLQSRVGHSQPNMENHMNPNENSYTGQPPVDEQLQKAVSYALQHRDMEERKAKEAERMAHVHKQYGELHKHLDDTADKYEDFDDVVRGHDAPFTDHIRDAALLLPRKGPGSAGEVLYKLGKNRSELDRISRLHPLDQASELVRLSHAMIGGADMKTAQPRPLGHIKSNPVSNSHAITEKTSPSEIRARMKEGRFK